MRFLRTISVCLLLLAGLVVLPPRQATARDLLVNRPIVVAQVLDLRLGIFPPRRLRPRFKQRRFLRPRIRRPFPPRRRGVFRPGRRVPRVRGNAPVLGASSALDKVMRQYPDGKPLGVRLLPGRKPVYAVRLRRGNRVIIKRIDATTGRVLR